MPTLERHVQSQLDELVAILTTILGTAHMAEWC